MEANYGKYVKKQLKKLEKDLVKLFVNIKYETPKVKNEVDAFVKKYNINLKEAA